MSDKRRGLGRGLGALIPTAAPPTRATGDRPVDVFFPSGEEETNAAPASTSNGQGGTATLTAPAPAPVRVTEPAPAAAGSLASVPVAKVASPPPSTPVPSPSIPVATLPTDTNETIGETTSTPASQATAPKAEPPAPATPTPESTSTEDTSSDLVPVPGARFAELDVTSIRPNPRQPRQVFDEEAMSELVHSVREIGVLQPIVVRQVADENGEARYELIMGERRWRATQAAGLDVIPAIIRDTQDDDLLRDALLENLHRSELNPLEEAAAYQQLLEDFGCTHEELATRIGRSRPQISNTIRLLRLPPVVQRRLAVGVLSAGHARALLGLDDTDAMERLAGRIVSEGLSVRAVEEIVALGDGTTTKPAKKRPRPGGHTAELDDLAARLADRLDTRVSVNLGRSRGRLSIDFASVEDLNRIVGLLSPDLKGAFSK